YDFLDYVTAYHKYPKASLFPPTNNEKLSAQEIAVWNACKEVSKWSQITVEVHINLSIEQEQQLFYDLNDKGKDVEKGL
ncbi:hypothetical protein, partial [Rhizobium leguminosarum]|uniref:hypothetical protein n=1 Tax=Rhizobium leguminosarum TaxID=384 RepID=UPI003F9E41AF